MWAHSGRGRTPLIAVAATVAATGLAAVAPAARAAAGCAVAYQVNQWTGGFTATVRVTAGDTAANGWAVTRSYAAGQRVTSAWNAEVTQSGATVTARNLAGMRRCQPAGPSSSECRAAPARPTLRRRRSR